MNYVCECGQPCSREGGLCRKCYMARAAEKRAAKPAPTRKKRSYSREEMERVLTVARKRGRATAARRFKIPVATIDDWIAQLRAFAYSSTYNPAGQRVTKEMLLEQLVEEQEIEDDQTVRRLPGRRPQGSRSLEEPYANYVADGDPLMLFLAPGERFAETVQRHLVEWLDPVGDEVASRER